MSRPGYHWPQGSKAMPLFTYDGIFHFQCERCPRQTGNYKKSDLEQAVKFHITEGWKFTRTTKDKKATALCPGHNPASGKKQLF